MFSVGDAAPAGWRWLTLQVVWAPIRVLSYTLPPCKVNYRQASGEW